jgi:hypothetical protein
LHLGEFEKLVERCNNAQSKVELSEVLNDYKENKRAYTDLLTMARAATRRLEASVASALKAAIDASSTIASKKRGRPGAKQVAAPPVVKLCQCAGDICAPIQSSNLDDTFGLLTPIDELLPNILRCSEGTLRLIKKLKAATKTLAQKFKNSPTYCNPGRASKKIVDEDLVEAKSMFNKLVANQVAPPANLTDTLSPSLFAIAKCSTIACAEPNHFTSLRLTLEGNRTIVAVQTKPLLDYLTSQTPGSAVMLKYVYAWLVTCTRENAKAFMATQSTPSMFVATIGPNDVLYLPAGWCYLEHVGSLDVVGVRSQYLLKSDRENLDVINNILIKSGKPNEHMQSAVDKLVLDA